MTSVRTPDYARVSHRLAGSRHGPLLAGLTCKSISLVALVCVVNGARRSSIELASNLPALEMLTRFATFVAGGLIVAIPVTLAVVATWNLVTGSAALRYAALALALALSSAIGVFAMLLFESGMAFKAVIADVPRAEFAIGFGDDPLAAFARSWVRYGLLCVLFATVFASLRTADRSAARAMSAERDRALLIERSDEARLRMLQAQIEPHFLFNTLANVRRLYQTAAANAVTMLDNLMRYFEVALPHMRAADSTLGREAELTESYLAIQRFRMGQRLAFAIEIPGQLREAKFPPMMLLTLAENAIKHGLAPLPEGGEIRISATVQENQLCVSVADSGRGFVESSGAGTGLANIRARLAGAYGAAARLTLRMNAPRGVVATIALPRLAYVPATPVAPAP
ncbi:MAG TPA: histidine kinase [Casimicrobiaceae bacterium]|nr:histidine kinase [Casimicrobiaceae bacterium]